MAVCAVSVVNHFFLRIPFFPYDRILSARSRDGLLWVAEPGIRVDVGGTHRSRQVYHPAAVRFADGWRLFYRAGGYDSIIASAFSTDGSTFQEEVGTRLGPESGLDSVAAPAVAGPIDGPWRMFFAGRNQGRWWVHGALSEDGLRWRDVQRLSLPLEAELVEARDPSVVSTASGYRLFFVGYDREARAVLYTSRSSDGVAWGRVEGCRGYAVEDREVRTPCVIPLTDGSFRLYLAEFPRASAIGSCIVSAVSNDGMNWERESGVRMSAGWPLQGVFAPNVVTTEEGMRMYLAGYWGWHWLAPYTLYSHRAKGGKNRLGLSD